jgi:hypothetical protein
VIGSGGVDGSSRPEKEKKELTRIFVKFVHRNLKHGRRLEKGAT